jgi:ketopantoate reductase
MIDYSVLESENRQYRQKISILIKKGDNDDKYIVALKQELEQVAKHRTKKNDEIYEALRAVCAEKEEQIVELKKQLQEKSGITTDSWQDRAKADSQKRELDYLRGEVQKLTEKLAKEMECNQTLSKFS